MMLPHLLAYRCRLICHTRTLDDATNLLVRTLGVSRRAAEEELELERGTSIRLEWLRVNFSKVRDSDTEDRIKSAARAYLLYLLGCTIFTDKSGGRVSISYLALLEDLGVVSTFAWGAASLAYLYRQLRYASRAHVKQITGYLSLLEVVWNPYQDSRDQHPLLDICFFTGCIKCVDIIEPYHLERVLRHFCRVQIIPPSPISPSHVRRGCIAAQYKLSFTFIDAFWERWRSHVLSQEERSVLVTYSWDAADQYID